MKRKTYGVVLMIEAVFCTALAFFGVGPGQVYWQAVSFPFAQIGAILRKLSLSGSAGNAAAILLYAVIGLLPTCCLLYRMYKKRAKWEDFLLGVLSVQLFFGIYLYINPALFAAFMPMSSMAEGGKLMISSCIWAVFAGYAVLRVLRSFGQKEGKEVFQLVFLLRCVGAVLIFQLCFLSFGTSLEALEKLKESNTAAAECQLFVTELVFGLHFLWDAAAAILELWMLLCGEKLLEALAADRYSEETEMRAHSLSEVCRITVYVSIGCCVGINLLQLLLCRSLLNADYLVQIPLGRMAFTLAVMLAAKYLAEGRRLKQENDLFI